MVFVLGIIPARGGSKGIPDKNVLPVGGKPLIAHTIEAARGSRLDDVILSTDSPRIAGCAAEYGLKAEGLRPDRLATDEASTIDVLRHEIPVYEARTGNKVDAVLLLQPTAPLRRSVDIDGALDVFLKSGADSLISVYDASAVHPRIMYTLAKGRLRPLLAEGGALVRRQEMEAVYVRNGAIYIASRELVMDGGRIVGDEPACYLMPRERSLNIDEPHDLKLAEFLLSAAGVEKAA